MLISFEAALFVIGMLAFFGMIALSIYVCAGSEYLPPCHRPLDSVERIHLTKQTWRPE